MADLPTEGEVTGSLVLTVLRYYVDDPSDDYGEPDSLWVSAVLRLMAMLGLLERRQVSRIPQTALGHVPGPKWAVTSAGLEFIALSPSDPVFVGVERRIAAIQTKVGRIALLASLQPFFVEEGKRP